MSWLPHEDFSLEAYAYDLPDELIAQEPASRREDSRLMVLDTRRPPGRDRAHERFSHVRELLRQGDVLVLNDTRVFPARLTGRKEASGGAVEVFLLEYPRERGQGRARARAMLRASRRPRKGSWVGIGEGLRIRLCADPEGGRAEVELCFDPDQGLDACLEEHGHMPLPPYIRRRDSPRDRERYQTCYAREPGAVAAPTAGLHFSPALLAELEARGVELVRITLHVGLGTFAPVRSPDIRAHRIHEESVEVSPASAARINAALEQGRRIWAVGTTSVRTLEFAARARDGGPVRVAALRGSCGLYIHPGFDFQVVDNLITNFHLPRSSLLFLVSALAGRKRILDAYQEAVEQGYRFFSYGDAMAIITR